MFVSVRISFAQDRALGWALETGEGRQRVKPCAAAKAWAQYQIKVSQGSPRLENAIRSQNLRLLSRLEAPEAHKVGSSSKEL